MNAYNCIHTFYIGMVLVKYTCREPEMVVLCTKSHPMESDVSLHRHRYRCTSISNILISTPGIQDDIIMWDAQFKLSRQHIDSSPINSINSESVQQPYSLKKYSELKVFFDTLS